MTPKDLFQEIKTISPIQRKSVYSFIYLLKYSDHLRFSEKHESINLLTTFKSEHDTSTDAQYKLKGLKD